MILILDKTFIISKKFNNFFCKTENTFSICDHGKENSYTFSHTEKVIDSKSENQKLKDKSNRIIK